MSKTDFFGAATDIPSSEDEEDGFIVDNDICAEYEIQQSFKQNYRIVDEAAVSLKKDYILSLCSDSAFTRVVGGLTNGTIQIFDISAQRGLSHISRTEALSEVDLYTTVANICGVRFLDDSPNNLLIGTTNGSVCLYDLRTSKEQARFVDSTDGNAKRITAFDRNANGRILCAGTEQIQSTVYLLFFDVRRRKKLGGYIESHQDDVTAVRFHEKNPDVLCTGSTDGLINIFDIEKTCEDDALITTINTESSVQKLNWHKNVYERDFISCITHTNDFKVYDSEEGEAIVDLDREVITAALKRKAPANCNLVGTHNTHDDSLFLLAGTNFKKGEVMRSLLLQNKQLLPLANFQGNKQIVRDSVFDAKTNALITAGESGILTVWMLGTDGQTGGAAGGSNPLKSKTKPNKRLPY